MRIVGRKGEIAGATVAYQNLDFICDRARPVVGGIQRPLSMNEEPALRSATGFARDRLAAQPDRKVEPGLIEPATCRACEPGFCRRIDMPCGGGEALMVDVKLNIVLGGRGHFLHRLATKMFLTLGSRSKTDEVLRGGPQQPVAAPQRVADIRLVEESETTGEVDALRGTTKVMDRLHGFRTDGQRRAERHAARLEVIGVDVSESTDLSPSQAFSEPIHKGRKRRHRSPQPRQPSCIAAHYRQRLGMPNSCGQLPRCGTRVTRRQDLSGSIFKRSAYRTGSRCRDLPLSLSIP